jgi:Mn2+/Fe2+ NRAMP family transporter
MEGFLKLKISKFKRALITRAIAIIPSLMIGWVD